MYLSPGKVLPRTVEYSRTAAQSPPTSPNQPNSAITSHRSTSKCSWHVQHCAVPASFLTTQPALCIICTQHIIWPSRCIILRHFSSCNTRLKARTTRASTEAPWGPPTPKKAAARPKATPSTQANAIQGKAARISGKWEEWAIRMVLPSSWAR